MRSAQIRRLAPWLGAVLVLALTLAVYWRTAAPTITFRNDGTDSGDLVTAAINLGVPHPTGYPLYTMIAHLATRLPGDPAGNVSRFSGLCAALAVATVFLTAYGWILRHEPDASSAVALVCAASAGGVFASGQLLWSQATIAEVYALSALLVAASFIVLSVDMGRARPYLLALLLGLNLAHHVTAIWLLPSLWPYFQTIRRWITPERLLRLLLCLAPGLLLYVYIPVRAVAQAVPNWGQASDLAGFRWLVTGEAYRGWVGSLSGQQWPQRIAAWSEIWVRDLGVIGLALVLLGVWSGFERDRRFTLLGLTYALLTSLYAMAYGTPDSYVYLVPVAGLMAMGMAAGAYSLLSEGLGMFHSVGSRRLACAILCLALLAMPAYSLLDNYRSMDLSLDREAYEYGSTMLQAAAGGAVLISRGDMETFPLWYLRYGLHQREDVIVVDRWLLALEWYRTQVAQLAPGLASLPQTGDHTAAAALLVSVLGAQRPVQLTYRDEDLLGSGTWSHDGLLYTLLP